MLGQSPITAGFPDANAWSSASAYNSAIYAPVEAAGLTYTGLTSTAGNFSYFRDSSSSSSGVKISTRAASTTDASQVVWVAFLMSVNQTPAVSFTANLNSNTVAGTLNVGINTARQAFFTFAGTGVSGTGNADAAALATNTSHLLVMKIEGPASGDAGTPDTFTLYVNPDLSLGEAGLTGGLTGSSANWRRDGGGVIQPFKSLALTGDVRRVSDTVDGFLRFDEFRVATSFDEAIGVPEPASVGLLSSGAIGLLARRRRARA
ncbi:MAG: PEP-CTERM sorting domain-containing protein [Phycisphaerae bacterium]|nr:PEP-CTERM sorting domain-containing protein [Tepidisphaeraceae bacterium]